MQKLINVVALLSGLTSLSLIGGSAYVLMNQEAWRAQAQLELRNLVVQGMQDALPGLLDSAMPEVEVPEVTGPALPMP
ncbi:MAG: hypothetical protein VW540_06025 [Gammaproteobacteria bacterium]|jgi:hypothetical protein|tara:strand:+ start:2259 stop:2492 length:234 start_codon:yes stop_codon:yes gene_type:complete